MSELQITWRNKRFTIAATKYVENDNTCLVLLGKDNLIEAKPTVNLAKLPPHLVFIKDWSENRGIAEVLVKREYIRHTGKTIRIGANEVKQYELTPAFGAALGISVPELESAVLDVDINADQTTAPTPQPPDLQQEKLEEDAKDMQGEIVESLEAVGLNVLTEKNIDPSSPDYIDPSK